MRDRGKELDRDAFDARQEKEEEKNLHARQQHQIELEHQREEKEDSRKLAEPVIHIEDEPSDIVVTRIMTKEERQEKMKEIIAGLPAEKEALWIYEIEWDNLDQVT